MLNICEIFKSIQGESSHSGLICSFIRLAGCNIRCSYCDTAYAWTEGTMRSVESIVQEVEQHGTRLVEITGGEPLMQNETPALCRALLETRHRVLVETNGTLDISALPAGTVRIVDVKCPGSGAQTPFLCANLEHLVPDDECKFVISDLFDFEWAATFVHDHGMDRRCGVIFSPNTSRLNPALLADWIVSGNLPVRLGLQLHKVIWGNDIRGV